MKLVRIKKRLPALVLMGLLTCILVIVPAGADDKRNSPADWYEAGRQAYFRNDFRTAKPYFVRVLQVEPNHIPSKAMLGKIREWEKKQGKKTSMQAWSKRVIIPRIDVEDAPIDEVIAFLRVKSRAVTKGAWEPNFILRKPASGELPAITLSIGKVPVDYLIQKVAELSGLAVRYEEHAIMIAPKELLPPEPDALTEAREKAAATEARKVEQK